MKIMKKIFKNRILIVIVTVILTGSISVYAAGRYYATQVDYEPSNPNFNVDNMSDALDQLYTTQNTTVNNLNSQITTKDQTISSLQSQVESLTAAASEKDYVTGTFKVKAGTTNSPDLGFYPSKALIYTQNASWSTLSILTRSGCIAFGGDNVGGGWSSSDCSYYWSITDTGFRSTNYTSSDGELKFNWTYYAFR